MMEHMAFKGVALVGTTDYNAEKPLLGRKSKRGMPYLDERRKGRTRTAH
jgi:hypothetical protein